MSPRDSKLLGLAVRLCSSASPAGWRARRARKQRIEQVQIEREIERRRRYYCRRALRGLDTAIAELEVEMAAAPVGDFIALTEH